MPRLKALFAVAFATFAIVACSGGQGDTCTTDSDCKSNLSCQTIEGRSSLYCCPTPATSSDYANCHPDLSNLGSSSSSGGTDAATGG